MSERLVDAGELAQLLGVPKSWVLAEARADRIPHVRLGRYVRFRESSVLEWLDGVEKAADRGESTSRLLHTTEKGPRMGACSIAPSIVPRCYFAHAAGPVGLSPRSAAFCAERSKHV